MIFYPSRIPDPGVLKAPDPGSGFATLQKTSSPDMVGFMAAQYGVAIKRAKTEDEYFNSEDEPEEAPAYQPKPGSPGPGNAQGT